MTTKQAAPATPLQVRAGSAEGSLQVTRQTERRTTRVVAEFYGFEAQDRINELLAYPRLMAEREQLKEALRELLDAAVSSKRGHIQPRSLIDREMRALLRQIEGEGK